MAGAAGAHLGSPSLTNLPGTLHPIRPTGLSSTPQRGAPQQTPHPSCSRAPQHPTPGTGPASPILPSSPHPSRVSPRCPVPPSTPFLPPSPAPFPVTKRARGGAGRAQRSGGCSQWCPRRLRGGGHTVGAVSRPCRALPCPTVPCPGSAALCSPPGGEDGLSPVALGGAGGGGSRDVRAPPALGAAPRLLLKGSSDEPRPSQPSQGG